MNNTDIHELKALFMQLLEIFQKHGDSSIKPQANTVRIILEVIDDGRYLNDEEKIVDIKIYFRKLYTPQGGFAEFYIWKEDFEERIAANEPLDKIRDRLEEVLR